MIIHFLWVLFMILGLPLGLWLRSPTLRWVHFMGMSVTALFAVLGIYCPLTMWEENFRWGADRSFNLEGGFLSHYISSLLYLDIEPWILRGAAILWGTLTALAMAAVRPGRGK